MIVLALLGPLNDTLIISSRPAILTYTPPLISASLAILNSPLLISGLKRDAETLIVPIIDRFEFAGSAPSTPRWAHLEISRHDNKIQVYSTKLIFIAQFEGVRFGHLTLWSNTTRWFMYYHRIAAFTIFISLFFLSSSFFAGLAWSIFYLRSSNMTPSHVLPTAISSSVEKENEGQTDDYFTRSPLAVVDPRVRRDSPLDAVSQILPSVADRSPTQRAFHQSHKAKLLSGSPTVSAQSEDSVSPIGIETDDTITNAEPQDDIETNERYTDPEVSF